MKAEAYIFSEADISWEVFVDFMLALQQPLQAHIETQTLDSGLHDVVMEKGDTLVFFSYHHIGDEYTASTFEHITHKMGINPCVAISISDVRDIDVVWPIVDAFARRWPCLYDRGAADLPSLPNAAIRERSQQLGLS